MVNVAVLEPPATVTVAGTVNGSWPESDTTAPVEGAAPLKVTVPITGLPPTTLPALRAMAESTGPPLTVSVEDWVLPIVPAEMVAAPADMAVTVNAALDDPA